MLFGLASCHGSGDIVGAHFHSLCLVKTLSNSQQAIVILRCGKESVEIVDSVLVAHHGPICKFEHYTRSERDEGIHRWILFLSRNGIKEFILFKLVGKAYKIPSSLFLCEELTHIELFGCSIFLPASFNGFKNLTTLALWNVNFSEDELQTLISVCPLLEELVLIYIHGCHHLKIYSVKLVSLFINMELEDLLLVSTPLLAELRIKLLKAEDPIVTDGAVFKLVQFFGSLPRIKRLALDGRTLRILSRGDVPSELPIAFWLHYLSLSLDFEDMQEMLAAFSIFRSSPNLETLDIEVHSSTKIPDENYIDGFWKPQEINCLFNQLQTLKMTHFLGTKSELGFIELVLASAPVLKTVQIGLEAKIDLKVDVYTRMLGFKRASSNAKIVFEMCCRTFFPQILLNLSMCICK